VNNKYPGFSPFDSKNTPAKPLIRQRRRTKNTTMISDLYGMYLSIIYDNEGVHGSLGGKKLIKSTVIRYGGRKQHFNTNMSFHRYILSGQNGDWKKRTEEKL
jgi:hypothetical protein